LEQQIFRTQCLDDNALQNFDRIEGMQADPKILLVWNRYLLYFILSIGISSFAYFSNLLYFQTNDDFTQMLITSGVLYGSPSSQLLYVAKPLSTIISQFYLLSQSYSWYTILLLVTQSVSLFGYLILLENTENLINKKLKFITKSILISPVLIFIIMFFALQYTQTAIMSATAGTLLVLFGRNIFLAFFGMGLIVLGIFWRAEAGVIAVLIVLGFYILSLLLDGNLVNIKHKLQKIGLILFSTIFSYAIFLAGFHEKSPFISAEKREAISYYKSLGKVLDYAPTKFARDNLHNNARKVGWSKNDFRLLNNKFYFANREVFTEDRNLRLTDLTAPGSTIKFYYQVAKNLNSILIDNHKRTLGFIFLLMLIIFLTFKIKRLYEIFFYLASIYGIFVLIMSLGRIPDRVLWPISFAILVSIGFILAQQSIEDATRSQKIESVSIEKSILLILGLLYILIFANLYDEYLKVDQELWWKFAKEEKIYGFDRVLTYEADKPIVAFSSFYSALLKTHSPAKPPSQSEDIWKNMILIGWTIRSPEVDQKIAQLDISQDLLTSIAQGEAYLATSDHLAEIDLLNRYFRQHRYINIKWAIAPFVYNDTGLGIWSVDSFEIIPPDE
jgi:hypothetical protein